MVRIFTNLKRCRLQLYNLDKIIFVTENWISDPRVGCNSPPSLTKLIEVDVGLEDKLKQYEGEFKQDELLDL